jgi:hypothetical protein
VRHSRPLGLASVVRSAAGDWRTPAGCLTVYR